MLSHSRKDLNSNFTSTVYEKSHVTNNIVTINGADAKTISDGIEQRLQENTIYETKKFCVLKLIQLKKDEKQTSKINKGIIGEITEDPVSVYFSQDSIKDEIFNSNDNPFLNYYVVDVEIKKLGEKIVVYTIFKLHEKNPI